MTTITIEDTIVSILRNLEKALPLCKAVVDRNQGWSFANTYGVYEIHALEGLLNYSSLVYPEHIRNHLVNLCSGISSNCGERKTLSEVTNYISEMIPDIRKYVDGMESNTTVIQFA